MNIVILIGRLASDVSLNEGKTVGSFRLAVSKDTAEGGADFIQCKAFGKQAENLQTYKHKGDEIAVVGRIETGSYTNREGKTVRTTDVICNRVEYTHGNKGGSSSVSNSVSSPKSADIPDSFAQFDDDIPFN